MYLASLHTLFSKRLCSVFVGGRLHSNTAFIFLFMSPSKIVSGGHYIAEDSKILFLLSG